MMLLPDKQILRGTLLKQCLLLSPKQQLEHAKQLFERVISLPLFKASDLIAAYLPIRGEINPLPILKYARQLKKRIVLPVLDPEKENHLLFSEYHWNDLLITNRFGILEPKFNPKKSIAIKDLSLVLTPLVAFDDSGTRLGKGKGYYDRTFADVKKMSSRSPLLGIAHEFQKVSYLPKAPWDVPLEGVITEKNYWNND